MQYSREVRTRLRTFFGRKSHVGRRSTVVRQGLAVLALKAMEKKKRAIHRVRGMMGRMRRKQEKEEGQGRPGRERRLRLDERLEGLRRLTMRLEKEDEA